MMQRQLFSILLIVLSAIISVNSYASGSGSYGQEEGSAVRVDRLYESGKLVYYARTAGGQAVEYCINDGQQVERVSRRSLKSFVGSSADKLTASLVRCDDTDTPVSEYLEQSDVEAVVYYLNKRYRLSLLQS